MTAVKLVWDKASLRRCVGLTRLLSQFQPSRNLPERLFGVPDKYFRLQLKSATRTRAVYSLEPTELFLDLLAALGTGKRKHEVVK